MKRNFILFFILFLFSILLSYPFGFITGSFAMSHGLSSFIVPNEISWILNGFFWIYLILTPLIFGIWGRGRRKLKIGIVALPALALAVFVGQDFLGWSLIFFVSSIILTTVINYFRSHQLHS
jgi:hypothetical protein